MNNKTRVLFYAKKGDRELTLRLYVYPGNSSAYFYSNDKNKQLSRLRGISEEVHVITRLYSQQKARKFAEILIAMTEKDEESVFRIKESFFYFLSGYIEQKRIYMKRIEKEILRNDPDFNRKALSGKRLRRSA